MKSISISTLIIGGLIALSSCTSLKTAESSAVSGIFADSAPVYIDEIKISPSYILNDVSEVIPEITRNCLINCGRKVTEEPAGDSIIMNILIHKKDWQYNFKPVQTITISIEITAENGASAYRLITMDTDKSIDSFQLLLKLLENTTGKLITEIENEK